MMRRALTLAAALCLVAAPVRAQRVAGTVRLPGGATNAGGMLVVAKDSAGVEIARAVTSAEGRYLLPLSRPGQTRVELQRVGFQPYVALERVVTVGEAVDLDFETTAHHTELAPRGPGIPNSCVFGEGASHVTGLMDETRKALVAIQVGLSRPGVTARWAVTDHRLMPNQRDTARFSIVRRSGALLAAFGSPVLNELQRSGYVVTAGRDRIFRGLDVPAMLSPWFAENYCFTADAGTPTTLTIGFAPKTRRRDYVDVTGQFILSRATLEVLWVEYEYVGLPADEDKRGAGGKISFGRTDGGTWLVTDWRIRFPAMGLLELETFRSQNAARVLSPEVLGVEVLGGHTLALIEGSRRTYVREAETNVGTETTAAMRTACGERVLNAATGAARGRLTVDGRPVSGSRVRATWRVQKDVGGEVPLWSDQIRETTSSNRGEWTLCDLAPGMDFELSWEVQGRRSTAILKVGKDQIVTVGPDGKIVEGATP